MNRPANATIRMRRRLGAALFSITSLAVLCVATGLVDLSDHADEPRVIAFRIGTQMTGSSDATLGAAASDLLGDPTSIAVITGHTGAQGDPDANHDLSLSRAVQVRDRLHDQGVPLDRMVVIGAGGEAPIARRDDESEGAWSARLPRAEIRILPRRMIAGMGGA